MIMDVWQAISVGRSLDSLIFQFGGSVTNLIVQDSAGLPSIKDAGPLNIFIQKVVYLFDCIGFCGDGVVDDGEECDCGGVVACIKGRSCCTPPGLEIISFFLKFQFLSTNYANS